MGTFKIEAGNFSWINGPDDDPDDLCLHGHAAALIGSERVEYDCTVSAAALGLLKSLTEDHIAGEGEQLLPCCGFFLVADEACRNVTIVGCDNGEDWSVLHKGEHVRLILPNGHEEIVPLADYREEVFRFADRVEAYYRACTPKNLPDDEFDRRGYEAFWNEWHRRRGGICPKLAVDEKSS